jgi:hypothetical protein
MLLLLCTLALHFPINAQQAIRTKHFNLSNGVALAGYDAVAYLKNRR